MRSRKWLPLGSALLLVAVMLIVWRAGSPSVPRDEEASPATLPGEPPAPVAQATAKARPVPEVAPTPQAEPPPPSGSAPRAPTEVAAPVATAGEGQGTAAILPSSSTTATAATQEASVSKDDIRGAIREVLPGLRRCYAPLAEKDPSTQKVVVRFTLVGQGSSGFFKDADILEESTVNDPIFLSCLLQELSQARFRAPWGTGEVTITYPFTLAGSPRDGGP